MHGRASTISASQLPGRENSHSSRSLREGRIVFLAGGQGIGRGGKGSARSARSARNKSSSLQNRVAVTERVRASELIGPRQMGGAPVA